MERKRAYAPHCDQSVLHAPARVDTVNTLVPDGKGAWILFTHPIDAPLGIEIADCISRGDLVQRGTLLPAIRLTARAANVLKLNRSLLSKQLSVAKQHRRHVPNVDRSIKDVIHLASIVGGNGDVNILPLKNNVEYLQVKNANGGNEFGLTLGNSVHNLAQIVVPISHGTSWSLITEIDQKNESTLELLRLRKSMKNLPDVMLSVLTVIESELTLERWKDESDTLNGECEYCDYYPEWQEYREVARINYTGHQDPNKAPCPSTTWRSLETIEKWGGNISTSSRDQMMIDYGEDD